MSIELYVGGYGAKIQGEHAALGGKRCFSAAHRLRLWQPLDDVECLLDSGAFTDVRTNQRLSVEEALERQLRWEVTHADKCATPGWQVKALVSYDRLIDEKFENGKRIKRRWTVKAAECAVEQTVEAARYLAAHRAELAPRTLVLSCQGVDALQYGECAVEVLRHAQPGDWFGLGGWCILGRWQTWLPEFWRTLYAVLPLVAGAGLRQAHIFGVLWRPALGGLLWLCDRLGLRISTDSSAPILSCTYTRSPKKAGVRAAYWRDNVSWWNDALANLRATPFYCEPPDLPTHRQLEMAFEEFAL